MTNFEKENVETVRRIARELDAIASGETYKCPKCGNVYNENDFDEKENKETGENKHVCKCGEIIADFEECQYSLYEYFRDALDIEYIIRHDGEYRGAVICIACGGPRIDIDTKSHAVLLYWGNDRAEWQFNGETADAIDEIFSENYECIRGR